MKMKMDILEQKGFRENPYSLPEAYLSGLRKRLSEIPDVHPVREENLWMHIRPMVSVVACVAAVLVAFAVVFNSIGPSPDGVSTQDILSYEQYASADLIPYTDPYIYFDEDIQRTDNYTEDELIEYLVDLKSIY